MRMTAAMRVQSLFHFAGRNDKFDLVPRDQFCRGQDLKVLPKQGNWRVRFLKTTVYIEVFCNLLETLHKLFYFIVLN